MQAWGQLGRDVLPTAEVGTPGPGIYRRNLCPTALCRAAFLGSRQKRSGTSQSCRNWKVGCVCSSWRQVVARLRTGLGLGDGSVTVEQARARRGLGRLIHLAELLQVTSFGGNGEERETEEVKQLPFALGSELPRLDAVGTMVAGPWWQ